MTPIEILEKIRLRFRQHDVSEMEDAQGRYLITLTDEDRIFVLVTIKAGCEPIVEQVSHRAAADASAEISLPVFLSLLENRTTAGEAFMAGEIAVDGDLGKALRLYALIAVQASN